MQETSKGCRYCVYLWTLCITATSKFISPLRVSSIEMRKKLATRGERGEVFTKSLWYIYIQIFFQCQQLKRFEKPSPDSIKVTRHLFATHGDLFCVLNAKFSYLKSNSYFFPQVSFQKMTT